MTHAHVGDKKKRTLIVGIFSIATNKIKATAVIKLCLKFKNNVTI